MLSLEDCIGFSGLDQDEVAVIAEHEHVPEIVAAEMGSEWLETPKGLYKLHCLFQDSLARTEAGANRDKARRLRQTYAHFLARYPVPRVL